MSPTWTQSLMRSQPHWWKMGYLAWFTKSLWYRFVFDVTSSWFGVRSIVVMGSGFIYLVKQNMNRIWCDTLLNAFHSLCAIQNLVWTLIWGQRFFCCHVYCVTLLKSFDKNNTVMETDSVARQMHQKMVHHWINTVTNRSREGGVPHSETC